jgi:glycosyltransferase involved in cell wall biosynthesis
MNILHFSTEDITGGAAKAAFRLHSALRDAGHRSHMLVRRKRSDDDDVTQIPPPPPRPWQSRFERLRQHIPGLRRSEIIANYTFNFDLEPQIDTSAIFENQDRRPDVICLHWITGLLNATLVRKLSDCYRSPVVWVMADQEPMTGGCHYSFGCDGFTRECGCCPQLNSTSKNDITHHTWKRKKDFLSSIPICFIAPTSWGVGRIRESSLFRNHRVELIPYPVDTNIFRPLDQRIARDLLHLPFGKKIIFCGATYLEDRRKGMKQLIESFAILAQMIDAGDEISREDIFLLIAGLNGKDLLGRLPFPGKYAGHFNDELTLALAYQASDIFLCPSIEDAGPMMIPEAMLCGTPVVAFQTGGAPDLIEPMKNGYLAQNHHPADLAQGLLQLLTSRSLPDMRIAAHRAAERAHRPSIVAQRHLNLYGELNQSSEDWYTDQTDGY